MSLFFVLCATFSIVASFSTLYNDALHVILHHLPTKERTEKFRAINRACYKTFQNTPDQRIIPNLQRLEFLLAEMTRQPCARDSHLIEIGIIHRNQSLNELHVIIFPKLINKWFQVFINDTETLSLISAELGLISLANDDVINDEEFDELSCAEISLLSASRYLVFDNNETDSAQMNLLRSVYEYCWECLIPTLPPFRSIHYLDENEHIINESQKHELHRLMDRFGLIIINDIGFQWNPRDLRLYINYYFQLERHGNVLEYGESIFEQLPPGFHLRWLLKIFDRMESEDWQDLFRTDHEEIVYIVQTAIISLHSMHNPHLLQTFLFQLKRGGVLHALSHRGFMEKVVTAVSAYPDGLWFISGFVKVLIQNENVYSTDVDSKLEMQSNAIAESVRLWSINNRNRSMHVITEGNVFDATLLDNLFDLQNVYKMIPNATSYLRTVTVSLYNKRLDWNFGKLIKQRWAHDLLLRYPFIANAAWKWHKKTMNEKRK